MAHPLEKILNKKTKTAIGLISGTSIDGIDAVIMKISGSGKKSAIKILDFQTYLVSREMRDAILRNSSLKTARVDEICRLNIAIGEIFADAALKICKKNNIKTSRVDFIGSHGQTIHHLPQPEQIGGFSSKSTLQIGDPSVIANLTSILTVGDFRVSDCAVGGDGAPLVPYLDYILFSSETVNRGLLNIGGISNITVLPANCKKKDVIAFDTGPGNMLIDGLTHRLYGMNFDKDSAIANRGNVNGKLFRFLLKEPYYQQGIPKSTGREHYGKQFIDRIVRMSLEIPDEDVIRTATEFTAFTIWYNYYNFIRRKTKINELIISGGGARNPVIFKRLENYFKGISVSKVEHNKIDVDNKESVLFAVLANECIHGNTANMPSVTGASKDVVLGKICLARN